MTASRDELIQPLIQALTEDIYEIELKQSQLAYFKLKELRSQQLKPGYSQVNREVEDELRRKAEIDEHGNKVYEMMIQRYGTGFTESDTGSLQSSEKEVTC